MKTKMLRTVVLTLVIFQLGCNADTASFQHPKHNPGGCYHKSIGAITAGSKIPVPGKCEQAHCPEDKSGALQIISCSPAGKTLRCADKEKVFPACCPRKCTSKDRLVGLPPIF